MPRRTGRLRSAIGNISIAAREHQGAAKEFSQLLDVFLAEGIDISVESICGFPIPKTTIHIQLGSDEEEEKG